MSSLTIQHSLGSILVTAIREEKEIEGIQIGGKKKKVKLSLFSDGMILFIENPKDATRKILELINEFSKAMKDRINTQKSETLYANNVPSEREIKKIISFTIATKNSKIPRNKPP